MRKVLFGAVAVAALLSPLSCGHGASGPAGSVHGKIMMGGGPVPGRSTSVGGTVTAQMGHRTVATQRIADGQEFSLSLPAGSYRLSAKNSDMQCFSANVVVTAGRSQAVTLWCSVK